MDERGSRHPPSSIFDLLLVYMDRYFGRFIDGVEWWATFLLALMVVLVCLGVFFRYLIDAALGWYDEFASSLLVWLTFYGAVSASSHRRHIGFETFVARL